MSSYILEIISDQNPVVVPTVTMLLNQHQRRVNHGNWKRLVSFFQIEVEIYLEREPFERTIYISVISAEYFKILKLKGTFRISYRQCSIKKGVIKIPKNSQKTVVSESPLFVLLDQHQYRVINGYWKKPSKFFLIKKMAPVQVFSCEFCKVFKNNFFR